MAAPGSSKQLFHINAKQHGAGTVAIAWQADGNYVATAGANRQVHIYDRYGQVVDDIGITAGGAILGMDWDSEGETLVIMQQNNSALIFWDAVSKKTHNVETNMRDLTWIKWSAVGPELAVGTGKGNLVLYNKRTTRITPLLGKHTKKITGGWWNTLNQLALVSEDKTVSLNEATGDLIKQEALKGIASEVLLPQAGTGRGARSELMSLLVSNKNVLILHLGGAMAPMELAFIPKYGDIVAHRWISDEFVIVAFAGGFVTVVAPRSKNAGEEVFAAQMFRTGVTDLQVCEAMRRVAVCGDRTIKFIDCITWRELPEDSITVPSTCEKLRWTPDGNVLSCGTTDGNVFNYLTRMPVLNAASGTTMAYLSSLREVVVKDVVDEGRRNLSIHIKMEPSFMGLGRHHVAMGMNNLCWFYACDNQGQQINEMHYMATVESISMSSTMAAVRYDGRLQLHMITGDPDGTRTKTFPEESEDARITSHHVTDQFLMYSTSRGSLIYYSIEDDAVPNEYRHEIGISHIFPNTAGTRVVFVDESLRGLLYNPVDISTLEIPEFPKGVTAILWDMYDRNTFVAVTLTEFHTYVYVPVSMKGADVAHIGVTDRINQDAPILLYNGVVSCQTPGGSVSAFTLTTHTLLTAPTDKVVKSDPPKQFRQALELRRLEEAVQCALAMDDEKVLQEVKNAAMELLDVQAALRAAVLTRDVGMVLALEKLQACEDRNLLGGSIAMFLGNYSLAQDLLLSSSRPVTALEMRSDLMQWEPAMRLAETLDPKRIPRICLQYADQLQALSEYESALERYQQAMQGTVVAGGKSVSVLLSEEHMALCRAGTARMHIKLGNTTKGFQIAVECGEAVCVECATIMEGMKQYQDAALLYEKGKNFEKAANLYITKLKDFKAATPLLAKVSTPKLHIKFAEAKLKQGQYREAADSFERGKDLDSVVKICLENLQAPQRAYGIVRKSRSTDGAAMIAKYCQGQSDFRTAIEFLIIAKDNAKAAEVARDHDLMDSFALFLGKDGTSAEYVSIAQYYENKQQWDRAGDFYEKAGQYQKALKLFLQVGDRALDRAIDVVGQARNEVLTHTLVDYLMGEHDRVPKDPNYIFRLYIALGNYRQAARTAVLIARQEMQELGNYKVAHKMLFDMFKDLDSQSIPVPRELEETLMLLHSYVLVKVLVKMGDHEAGARMLIRAAKNISKFPTHVVPILTSTVIECQRAGLKKTSFEYASMLMRPEYRSQIAEAYKKKIESIVRKPTKQEEEEPVTPCPYCSFKSPCTTLDCVQCKNRVPYCIATGLRMVANDWTFCPSCRFPAHHSKFKALIDSEKTCPMCEQEIVPSSIVKVDNPEEFLNRAAKQLETEEQAKET
mmetsp:Transcript_44380/g.108454  ORF Transcript_44380/g.108454 Transcript_44380/m.108454 type:complete len:1358 (+) Transcript_44380:80-4153(+)